MRYIFNFPDIGEGLEEGTILEWYVTKGQAVSTGDSLVKMETDKVVADIPSPRTGTVVALFGDVGDVIKVGSPLVEIEIEGVFAEEAQEEVKKEFAPEPEPEEKAETVVGTMEMAAASAVLPASHEGTDASESEKPQSPRKALATPVARAMAKEMNIDINEVTGSGPAGRVTKDDILKYKPKKKAASPKIPENTLADDEVTYEPLSQLRKTIAKNMLNSKHNAAHMSVFEEVEISDLIKIRNNYKKKYADKGAKLTYLPFIVKAVVHALKEHRQLNSRMDWENDRLIFNNRYNISLAVDTPDGLIVPVIKDADKLSIFELAQRIEEISEKARKRQLTIDDMKGGTFSITNFGSIGGIFATPVINYPQAAILGVGRILKTAVVKNDELVVGNVMTLSLSVDHRIVDGGEVTRFIRKIMEYLSDPVALLME
ncbi:MAG: dihydrolipoamide acetyltransferase family protein [Bacteroidia bacterium]|nr:dihydrolipoamide acetyltransferase family protein [Bacteroidia bacterium]